MVAGKQTLSEAPISVKTVDNFIRLACCVEEIDDRISSAPAHHVWQWNSRRNTAVFLLNRIADQLAVGDQCVDLPSLSKLQRKQLADQHPLLGAIEATDRKASTSNWQPDRKLRTLITRLHES